MAKDNEISFKTKLFDLIRFFFRLPFIERILITLKTTSKAFEKIVPNYYQYKHKTLRSYSRKGIHFKVDISDWLGYCAYFNIKNEPYDVLFSLIKKNMTIIDVGSNIGFMALNMASLTGNNGIVYAFEPDWYNYTYLKNNIDLNQGLNIKSFQLGVGSTTEKRKLVVFNESNRGENKITLDPGTKSYSEISIITLDDFIEEKNIQRIDVLKIDTEGFEMNVLKGAKKLIERFKPILFVEIDEENIREQGSSAKEVIIHLINLGYTITSAQTQETVTAGYNFGNHFDAVCKINS